MFPILLQFSTNWFEKRPVWMALLLFTWVRSLTRSDLGSPASGAKEKPLRHVLGGFLVFRGNL